VTSLCSASLDLETYDDDDDDDDDEEEEEEEEKEEEEERIHVANICRKSERLYDL